MRPTLWWTVAVLASPTEGKASGAASFNSNPFTVLAKNGIASDRLNDLSSGLRAQEECHCSLACDVLVSALGSDGVGTPGQASYDAARARFWSNQQSLETKPACFVFPADAEEVSIVVQLARATECSFAVKGGGHTAFKASSGSHGGISIDFVRMKQITLSADRKSVAIEPGNIWYDVYTTLEKSNLAMAGGRAATVGVSGLALSGGISFFSGQRGWTCDNIASYEVVLASGEIINVDSETNADLYWALRGGGGNFGIVTKFVADTFDQGPMWGGFLSWEMHSSKVALIDVMIDYLAKGAKDPKAALIVSFAYAQIYQMWLSTIIVDYSEPQPSGGHPAVFDRFFGVDNLLRDTTRTTLLSNLTLEIAEATPAGSRQSYWTLTTRVDRQLAIDMLTAFHEEIEPLQDVKGFLPSFIFQLVTEPQRAEMLRRGGNALGLGAAAGEPLLLMNYAIMWADAADDVAVLSATARAVARARARAQERGVDHPFLYANYASEYQDPIPGYGAANVARLREVSRKYDPEGVFARLHPGHFKFEGPPRQPWW
ncbi:FAD-binding domain-containing protein [Durotheca rogersii]|uniref:FAD-binding domain-containing protein n=1 Tax=Durotheca rogersii TaxID=419775 RepID=UPI0022201802|nr:FAD-binding domain-containing protein [Durotheca rogersii]KAI5866329.1 FAD-binding domain-containing protein [Durotheca rogersii]